MKKLLKFYTPSCGPCKVLGVKLDTLLPQHPQIELEAINAADPLNAERVAKYGIRAVPALVLVDENNWAKVTMTGYNGSSDLEVFLDAIDAEV